MIKPKDDTATGAEGAASQMSEPLKRAPNSVDVLVGQRVRLRRVLCGLSQQALGEKLGLTFQQVQKYEKGLNRISASKLHHIASVLGTPVSFFFQTEDEEAAVSDAGLAALLSDRDAVSVLRAFSQIQDHTLRRAVVDHVRNIASFNAVGAPKSDR